MNTDPDAHIKLVRDLRDAGSWYYAIFFLGSFKS